MTAEDFRRIALGFEGVKERICRLAGGGSTAGTPIIPTLPPILAIPACDLMNCHPDAARRSLGD
jgi:hypothetical protein